MVKIMKEKAPTYLINLIRNNSILTFNCRTDCFKYFFPSTINDWFSLDPNIRNAEFTIQK